MLNTSHDHKTFTSECVDFASVSTQLLGPHGEAVRLHRTPAHAGPVRQVGTVATMGTHPVLVGYESHEPIRVRVRAAHSDSPPRAPTGWLSLRSQQQARRRSVIVPRGRDLDEQVRELDVREVREEDTHEEVAREEVAPEELVEERVVETPRTPPAGQDEQSEDEVLASLLEEEVTETQEEALAAFPMLDKEEPSDEVAWWKEQLARQVENHELDMQKQVDREEELLGEMELLRSQLNPDTVDLVEQLQDEKARTAELLATITRQQNTIKSLVREREEGAAGSVPLLQEQLDDKTRLAEQLAEREESLEGELQALANRLAHVESERDHLSAKLSKYGDTESFDDQDDATASPSGLLAALQEERRRVDELRKDRAELIKRMGAMKAPPASGATDGGHAEWLRQSLCDTKQQLKHAQERAQFWEGKEKEYSRMAEEYETMRDEFTALQQELARLKNQEQPSEPQQDLQTAASELKQFLIAPEKADEAMQQERLARSALHLDLERMKLIHRQLDDRATQLDARCQELERERDTLARSLEEAKALLQQQEAFQHDSATERDSFWQAKLEMAQLATQQKEEVIRMTQQDCETLKERVRSVQQSEYALLAGQTELRASLRLKQEELRVVNYDRECLSEQLGAAVEHVQMLQDDLHALRTRRPAAGKADDVELAAMRDVQAAQRSRILELEAHLAAARQDSQRADALAAEVQSLKIANTTLQDYISQHAASAAPAQWEHWKAAQQRTTARLAELQTSLQETEEALARARASQTHPGEAEAAELDRLREFEQQAQGELAQLAGLKALLNDKMAEIERLTVEQATMADQLERAREQLAALSESSVQRVRRSEESANQQLRELRALVEEHRATAERAMDELDALHDAVRRKDTAQQELLEQNHQLEAQLRTEKAKIAPMSQEIESLKAHSSVLQQFIERSSRQQTEEELSTVNAEMRAAELDAELSSTRTTLQETRGQLSMSQRVLAELKKRNELMAAQLNEQETNTRALLHELQGELQATRQRESQLKEAHADALGKLAVAEAEAEAFHAEQAPYSTPPRRPGRHVRSASSVDTRTLREAQKLVRTTREDLQKQHDRERALLSVQVTLERKLEAATRELVGTQQLVDQLRRENAELKKWDGEEPVHGDLKAENESLHERLESLHTRHTSTMEELSAMANVLQRTQAEALRAGEHVTSHPAVGDAEAVQEELLKTKTQLAVLQQYLRNSPSEAQLLRRLEESEGEGEVLKVRLSDAESKAEELDATLGEYRRALAEAQAKYMTGLQLLDAARLKEEHLQSLVAAREEERDALLAECTQLAARLPAVEEVHDERAMERVQAELDQAKRLLKSKQADNYRLWQQLSELRAEQDRHAQLVEQRQRELENAGQSISLLSREHNRAMAELASQSRLLETQQTALERLQVVEQQLSQVSAEVQVAEAREMQQRQALLDKLNSVAE